MTREEAIEKIFAERIEQDKLWRKGRDKERQYEFAAPHVVLLSNNTRKLEDLWYRSVEEDDLQDRFVKIAALALRALEEVKW